MYVFLTILIFLAAILLTLIVLVQNSKGGGLASGFSSSNQVMGVRKTTDFLEKFTWTLAGTIAVLSIISAGFVKDAQDVQQGSAIQQEVLNAIPTDPNTVMPNFDNQVQGEAAEVPAN